VIAWHLLTDQCDYQDLGGDYFAQRDNDRQRQRLVSQLQALGFRVTLDPPPHRTPSQGHSPFSDAASNRPRGNHRAAMS
jgi:hypothetical protein